MEFPYVLIATFSAGVIAQAAKIVLKVRKRKFSPELLDAYGGMPSAHSAFLLSLLTAVFLTEGVTSTMFGITALMTAIMIRDALGLRMILEEHGVTISHLANELHKRDPSTRDDKKYRIEHRVGHTIPEVIVGSAIGITVALILWFALKANGTIA